MIIKRVTAATIYICRPPQIVCLKIIFFTFSWVILYSVLCLSLKPMISPCSGSCYGFKIIQIKVIATIFTIFIATASTFYCMGSRKNLFEFLSKLQLILLTQIWTILVDHLLPFHRLKHYSISFSCDFCIGRNKL